MTKKNIQSVWRVTGNWIINRNKALTHPGVQRDREWTPEDALLSSDPLTPSTSRQLHRLARPEPSSLNRTFQKISGAFQRKEIELVLKDQRIQQLEAALERSKAKKRKKVPIPNKRFMQLSDILGSDQSVEKIDLDILQEIVVALSDLEEEEEEEAEELKIHPILHQCILALGSKFENQ